MSYVSVMMLSWWNPNAPNRVSFHVNLRNVIACVNNDIDKRSNTRNHDEDEKAKITNMDLEELKSYVLNHEDGKIEELIERFVTKKAQAERMADEILHAKAAKEILSINNRNNDM
ncbi:unnamed protein product [Ilex paraguariensis]|uniref:Uncharacterized protein n=1 Tax=Ilex paraguariensis TaxID=185542 RepID=A0ABC8U7H8_9AQUA